MLMKILIIHQHFSTPEAGGSMRSYYLSQGLQQRGHQVEVITAHNQRHGYTQVQNGVRIHFMPVFYENHLGFWSRIYAFAKFARMALHKAKTLEAIDLCYALSTPLTVGWIALKLKSQRNLPFIFEVGDLWPEAPIQMGVIKSTMLIKRLRSLEKKIYQEASQVVALSPDIEEAILKVVPECPVSVVPNMADCQYFRYSAESNKRYRDLDLQGKFVILYFGTAGKANYLEFLLRVAGSTEERDPGIHFLVVGRGSELDRIKSLGRGLRNMTFLDYMPKDEIRKVLDISDAIYISFAALPVLQTGSPNKFFDGLAAGKLVIINFKGWLKQVVEQHQLGFYADPQQPENFAKLIRPFKDDPKLLRRFQKNARQAGEQLYSKEIALDRIDRIITTQKPQFNDSAVYTVTE